MWTFSAARALGPARPIVFGTFGWPARRPAEEHGPLLALLSTVRL